MRNKRLRLVSEQRKTKRGEAGAGGVLKEFLGGDVPLGAWNP